MIYIVEIPREGRPKAWFAFDLADLGRKARQGREENGRVVYAALSAGEMLAAKGVVKDGPEARSKYAEVFELGDRHGWDTPLFRADYLLDEPGWHSNPVAELDAYVAAIGDGNSLCKVYLSDGAAEAALYQDPIYQGREGFYAHMALREQLIALEVISDDM